MKRTTSVIIWILGMLFLLAGCDAVNSETEKNAKDYKSSILLDEDYLGSKLESWIESCKSSDGYYELINSDPDSWDLYIYYPNINENLEYIRYKVDLKIAERAEGRILIVYLSTQNADSDEQVVKDLVLEVKAPLRGAWPTQSEVYVEGKKVNCIDRSYRD